MKTFLDGRIVLHAGDCREVIKSLADNSIDAIVCDPPYALVSIAKRFGKPGSAPPKRLEKLNNDGGRTESPYYRASAGFMGQKWDTGEVAFNPEFWVEALRVLKPGGHLLAFGGDRTYHRLACAIEDSGFEIRRMILWIFGQGFPKSHDVSKGIDQAAGAKREIVGKKTGRAATPVQDIRGGSYAGGNGKNSAMDCSAITAPATDAARQWAGWGSDLKPAVEPICMARKPLSEKSIAANVLKWGTGAINVDATRITTSDAMQGSRNPSANGGVIYGVDYGGVYKQNNLGRWPANVCHDGSDEVLAGFPDTGISTSGGMKDLRRGKLFQGATNPNITEHSGLGDSGSAARFFFQAKQDEEYFEEVKIEWISESGQCQVLLLVAMEQSLPRVIAASAYEDDNGWSMFLFGNMLMDLFQMAEKFIIETVTSSTTELRIWNYLTTLHTNACIADVSLKTELGGSRAANVEAFGPSLIIILGRTESLPGANRAVSQTPLKISVRESWQPRSTKRFHYTAKASQDSRLGSSHPTIKPLDLIQWLCRLITPPNGVILDCFAGTGTTGEAAFHEGFNAVLIERETEYLADIERRMGLVKSGKTSRKHASAKAKAREMDHGPLFGTQPAASRTREA